MAGEGACSAQAVMGLAPPYLMSHPGARVPSPAGMMSGRSCKDSLGNLSKKPCTSCPREDCSTIPATTLTCIMNAVVGPHCWQLHITVIFYAYISRACVRAAPTNLFSMACARQRTVGQLAACMWPAPAQWPCDCRSARACRCNVLLCNMPTSHHAWAAPSAAAASPRLPARLRCSSWCHQHVAGANNDFLPFECRSTVGAMGGEWARHHVMRLLLLPSMLNVLLDARIHIRTVMVPPAVSAKEPAKQKGAKAFKDAFSKSNVEAHLSSVRH